MEFDLLVFIIIYLITLILYILSDINVFTKIKEWLFLDAINYITVTSFLSIIITLFVAVFPPLLPDWLSLKSADSKVEFFDQVISIVLSFTAVFIAILIILHEFLQKNLGNYPKKYLIENKSTVLLFMTLIINLVTAFTSKILFNVEWINQVSLIYYNYYTFGFLIIICIPLLINIFRTINIESIISTEILNLPSPVGPFESHLDPWPTLKSIIYSTNDKNPNLTIHILDGIYLRLIEYSIPYHYTKYPASTFFEYFKEIRNISSGLSINVIEDRLSMFYFELLKSNNGPIFKNDCIDAISDHVDHFISTKNANGFERFLFRFSDYFKYIIEKRNISDEIEYCAIKQPAKIVFYNVENYYDKNIIDLHNTIFRKSQSDIIYLSSTLHNLNSLIYILSSMNLCEKINKYIVFNILESNIMVVSSIRNVEYSKLWLDFLLEPLLFKSLLKLKFNRIDTFCTEIGFFVSDLIKSQCFTFSECNSLIMFIRVALNRAESNYQNNNDFLLKDKHFIYFFKLLLSVKKDAIENYTILDNKFKYDSILKFANEIEAISKFMKSVKKETLLKQLKSEYYKFNSYQYFPHLEEEE